MKTREK